MPIKGGVQVGRADRSIRLSADVGGTFTDIAAFNERTGEFSLGKTLTTPARLVDGIATGVTKAETTFADARLFLHGTTIAINTILERTGATRALLTTQGFRDIYEIGRVNRPEAYNLFFRKHQPLIERALRFEIRERIDAQGNDPASSSTRSRSAASSADLVAAGSRGHRDPFPALLSQSGARAARQGDRGGEHPDLFVSASHELSQEYREFERTSTVAANAYVGPRVRDYSRLTATSISAKRISTARS